MTEEFFIAKNTHHTSMKIGKKNTCLYSKKKKVKNKKRLLAYFGLILMHLV